MRSVSLLLQGNLQHEYAGSDSVLLDRQELISLLGYLNQCMYFSKKPYNVFLEYGGYGQNDVLIKKSKARVRKYQFTLCCQLFVETQMSQTCHRRFFFSVRSTADNKSRVTG